MVQLRITRLVQLLVWSQRSCMIHRSLAFVIPYPTSAASHCTSGVHRPPAPPGPKLKMDGRLALGEGLQAGLQMGPADKPSVAILRWRRTWQLDVADRRARQHGAASLMRAASAGSNQSGSAVKTVVVGVVVVASVTCVEPFLPASYVCFPPLRAPALLDEMLLSVVLCDDWAPQ